MAGKELVISSRRSEPIYSLERNFEFFYVILEVTGAIDTPTSIPHVQALPSGIPEPPDG